MYSSYINVNVKLKSSNVNGVKLPERYYFNSATTAVCA